MRVSFLILIAVFFVSCTVNEGDVRPQAELENVARCLHASTFLLQAEPDTPDDFAKFLRRAKAATTNAESVPKNADFGALRWTADGASLLTESGDRIECRILKQVHDNYGNAATAWLTEYEFYIPETEHRARTTVELSLKH